MFRKVISGLLSVSMLTVLLTGCAANTGNTNSTDDTGVTTEPDTTVVVDDTVDQPAPPEEETEAGPSGTVKVAVVEGAYGIDLWNAVIEGFNGVYPDVQVELILDKYVEDIVGPAMKAGDFPDAIHVATGRPLALTESFIKDQAMVDLTDLMAMTVPGESVTVGEKIIPGFLDSNATNPYPDGKTYMTPTFFDPCGLFYNAALFEEKGWTVPTTWDEMWALGDLAQEEGIYLFAYPTAGYFDAVFYGLLYEAGGPDFFKSATNYAEGIWDTPEAQSVFDIVAKLATYTEPSVPANANQENFLKNQQLLLDNKVLFSPNGTWLPGEMADAPRAEGFEYGFTALPAITAGGDRYSFAWFEQAWIPAGAENPDLAKIWFAYLYSDAAADIFAQFDATVAIPGAGERLSGEKQLFYSIYDDGAKVALGNFAATTPVEGVNPNTVWFDPVNSLVSGDKTAETWIADVKAASDQLRAALIVE
ncbi:MAG: carbohydrate ABC transporter substrate-binding protein [Lachnospiraceae bacterium]|nr:carbohydrate ABC transporter substrate-binding protein [Lachnospiraceae bacterium]